MSKEKGSSGEGLDLTSLVAGIIDRAREEEEVRAQNALKEAEQRAQRKAADEKRLIDNGLLRKERYAEIVKLLNQHPFDKGSVWIEADKFLAAPSEVQEMGVLVSLTLRKPSIRLGRGDTTNILVKVLTPSARSLVSELFGFTESTQRWLGLESMTMRDFVRYFSFNYHATPTSLAAYVREDKEDIAGRTVQHLRGIPLGSMPDTQPTPAQTHLHPPTRSFGAPSNRNLK